MDKEIEFEKFENEVIEKLLDGDNDVLKTLRYQYNQVNERHREFTGVGFFTTFSTKENNSKLEPQISFQIGDVIGKINSVKNGVGFVLFIKNGILTMLEGYTYGDEKWPSEITSFELSYTSGLLRDFEKLKAKINEQLNIGTVNTI